MALKDLEIDWYCDSCNAYMNSQSGFNRRGGYWKCKECGYSNDVTNGNIYYDDETLDSLTTSELERINKDYEAFDKRHSKKYDDDFILADICRGGDLTEED